MFLTLSIALLLPPAMVAQGADAAAVQGTTGQPKKTTAPSPSKTVAKTPAAGQKNTKKQPVATVAKPVAAKKSTARQQSAGQAAPSTARHAVNKQAATVKKTAAVPAVTARKKSTASRQSAKKKRTQSISPPVYTDSTGDLPDIAKQISSKSVMVMDASTGDTIFCKFPDNPRQPASTIKIVTAMIALKSLDSEDVINVSQRAADMPSSKIFLDPGREYQANDLINAVLLASANDASVALAEKIAGSEAKFANLMTLSARMWGAQNTVCRTASGLTAEGQQSTARDLANLFRYAMQHDEFSRRMRERAIRTSYGKTLRNHNKALWRLDGAVGGKTGYTVAARQTYVGQFTREGQTIVVSIMGSESMWADLEKLVNYGFRKKKADQVAHLHSADRTADATVRVN